MAVTTALVTVAIYISPKGLCYITGLKHDDTKVLVRADTNCDHETKYAFELAGGRADRVHLNQVLENPALVEQYQIMYPRWI